MLYPRQLIPQATQTQRHTELGNQLSAELAEEMSPQSYKEMRAKAKQSGGDGDHLH